MRVLKARTAQEIRVNDRAAWTVWHIGILVRKALSHKKNGQYADYPKLETLLSTGKTKPRQTSAQMLAVTAMLNAAFGGAVVPMVKD